MTSSILPASASASSRAADFGRGAEFRPAVDDHDLRRHLGQRQRPVDRGIAAAGDDHALAAEILAPLDEVEDALALVFLDAGERRAVGAERADAGGDDHRACASIVVPRDVSTPEAAAGQRRHALDLLAR